MAEDQVDIAIGARVRAVRTQRGLSQGDMADLLRRQGIPWSQGTLSKVETGDRPIRLSEAPLVAHALGLELEELAAGKSRVAAALRRAGVVVREARYQLDNAQTELR